LNGKYKKQHGAVGEVQLRRKRKAEEGIINRGGWRGVLGNYQLTKIRKTGNPSRTRRLKNRRGGGGGFKKGKGELKKKGN